uniref:Putative salivary lipocalin n=1 Tax=Ixodes ricinus TaxID=34613 RepID=A0A0K8RIL2_IXORI
MLRIAVAAALCCVGIGAISSSQNATKHRYQELNPNLSVYQDAWKSNTDNATYVLAYRTSQGFPWIQTLRCVTGTLIAIHRNNRTAIHRLDYYNTEKRKWEGHKVLTKFNATRGYKVPNLMRISSYHNQTDRGRLYWTLYSEYGSCNIVRVRRNGDCELWVKERSPRQHIKLLLVHL